jgi:2-methylcitrate dehydratase PrpD
MVHAMDFDNNYPGADIHILSIAVPVALACGEERGSSGRRFLSSIILGVETAARIAKPYMRAARPHSYFLTTSLVGGWGGVATAARMLDLTIDQTVHAMGIYYAHTCGNRQALLEKALTKRIQPAIAAKAAVYSVLLAQRGFTGPEQTFEGQGGFYRCYTQSPPPPEDSYLDTSLNAIGELVVKHYPTCGIHHANIVSALHLKQQYGFAAGDIERVEFFLREGGNTLVSMPFVPGPCPQVDAQFCAPYAIALALNRGSVSVRDFTPERILRDRSTTRLAQRTKEITRFEDLALKCHPHPRPGCRYTKVVLRDGRVLQHECRGDALHLAAAVGRPKAQEKLRDCMSTCGEVGSDVVERVERAVLDVQRTGDIRDFLAATLGRQPVPFSC